MTLQHFILTRFNILLWRKDKSGAPVRSREWLEHRFSLFERFCLPSLVGQTCGEFVLEAGGECPGIQVPMGQYHTLVCLEDGSVIFEAKDRAYDPAGTADIL